jgi:hypothetical protein
VNLPKDKAEEILELCLKDSSDQMRAKVYEVINQSGIKTNDPMFLVLALTGQMRVFLEAAPEQLGELLFDWKSQSSKSIAELTNAIAEVKTSQLEHLQTIEQSISEINNEGIDNLRASHKTLISEVLSVNTFVEQQIQDTLSKLIKIQSEIKADRETNIKVMRSLIEGVGKTNNDLDKLNYEIKKSITSLNKISVVKKRVTSTFIVLSGFVIVIGSAIGLKFLTTQKTEQSSSNEFNYHYAKVLSLQASVEFK